MQIVCGNNTFADPAVGRVKRRGVMPYFSAGWQNCAAENGNCAVSDAAGQKWIVRYGTDPKWSATQTVTLGGGNAYIACTNAQFGDPYPGVVKRCERQRIQ